MERSRVHTTHDCGLEFGHVWDDSKRCVCVGVALEMPALVTDPQWGKEGGPSTQTVGNQSDIRYGTAGVNEETKGDADGDGRASLEATAGGDGPPHRKRQPVVMAAPHRKRQSNGSRVVLEKRWRKRRRQRRGWRRWPCSTHVCSTQGGCWAMLRERRRERRGGTNGENGSEDDHAPEERY